MAADKVLFQLKGSKFFPVQVDSSQKGIYVHDCKQEVTKVVYLVKMADNLLNESNTQYLSVLGVIAFDDKTGFWLIHSMPKYPQRKDDGYKWCDNVDTYGQSFLCISMSTSEALDKIGKYA